MSPSRGSSFGPLLAAVVAGAAAEAVLAARASFARAPDVVGTGAAGLFAFGLTALTGLSIVVWLGLLLDRPRVRRLGRALQAGLGGDGERAGLAVIAALTALAAAFAVGLLAGRTLVQKLSPPFAAAGTAVVTLLALAILTVFVAWLAGGVAWLLDRLEGRLPVLVHVPGHAAAVAVTAVGLGGALGLRLGGHYAALPVAALAALTVALTPAGGRRLARMVPSGKRGILAALVLLAACVPAALLPRRAPSSARGALLHGTPYLSVLLNGAERLWDRDGDKHSPILLGGDCNDRNKSVHPGAAEIPGNGIDENCSGADAAPYVSPSPPVAERPEHLPPKMNVLFVLVDALRLDHLGFAGYSRATSPHLDRFREEATWFKHAYTTAPRTRDALASLLTGLYPARIPIKEGAGTHNLDSSATTFPEVISPLGYDNVGYTITYVMKRFRNYQQGFRLWNAPWGDKDWSWEWTRAAPHTTEAALSYLATVPPEQGKPWFLFLHYRCTHDPYYKHEKDFGDRDIDKYDSALHHCDHHIGRVLDAVAARDDASKTAVFLFADHGELFGEHGHTFHGETLYEPDVRLVLLGKVPGATVGAVAVPVTIADLAPTVVQLAGARVPRGLDGWSLLPLFFRGEPDAPWRQRRLFITSELNRANIQYRLAGVVEWPHKYVWDMRTGARELFDVVKDPAELTPLEDDARGTALAELLESWLASSGTVRPP